MSFVSKEKNIFIIALVNRIRGGSLDLERQPDLVDNPVRSVEENFTTPFSISFSIDRQVLYFFTVRRQNHNFLVQISREIQDPGPDKQIVLHFD
jgi:hypothetical protein